jgi:hypothetical protein
MEDLGIDLYAQEDLDFTIEELPEGTALSSWATAGSASTASCPATSASSVSSASTYG